MSRIEFKTGKSHQEAAARWARQRLADSTGRRFSSPEDQDGVLLADSVGMGKTWEAIAAAALILYKRKRKNGILHVLVLCPANLITKWESELAQRSGLGEAVRRWANGKPYAEPVRKTLSKVYPIRRESHVATRRRYYRFIPHGGTYIVSHNLISRRGRGLSALRRYPWDVVIVDEAHQLSARKALDAVQSDKRVRTKILLSATPFQLEPREWNSLARHILKYGQDIFSKGALKDYLDRVSRVFDGNDAGGPKPAHVRDASDLLRKLAVRNSPPRSKRSYGFILQDGRELPLPLSIGYLGVADVDKVLQGLRTRFSEGSPAFDRAYLERRYQLATNSERTYVATALRRFLAMGSRGTKGVTSPRLTALAQWATRQFQEDIAHALKTGTPHKTIVFTSWVGNSDGGEAATLQRELSSAFSTAMNGEARRHGADWKCWHARGRLRLERTDDAVLKRLAQDELTCVLAGKRERYVATLCQALATRRGAVDDVTAQRAEIEDKHSFEARALKRRIRDMTDAMNPWQKRILKPVERYTGQEQRTERDRAASGFRELGPPWVLVASNVGAEGIDLQTYTRRIVHYDLEWNPARMEQREGRGDRVGRRLKEDISVLYCIVPNTYDERMFHQLVARDRWHGVLLGKPSQVLSDEDVDVPMLGADLLRKIRLDLKPR